MRKKIPNEEKKKPTSVKIDSDIIDLLDRYIEVNGITNKSKFIEEIVSKELNKLNKNNDV